MRKLPTLFAKQYDERGKYIGVSDQVAPDMGWVLNGYGSATVKYDGTCAALINGEFYKRYDAKKGKTPPEGAIPCETHPDPETGHWPHWVKIDPEDPANKWYIATINDERNSWIELAREISETYMTRFTMEFVGPHFNGNPYGMSYDRILIHGLEDCEVKRSYEGIRKFLENHPEMEGLVFWRFGQPQCKIRRKDFGLEWPVKGFSVEGKI